jgi:diketogulonate reductase-like aldo/keto reductase
MSEVIWFAIPKAVRADHAQENAKAGDLTLGAAEIARIDAAFPLGKPAPCRCCEHPIGGAEWHLRRST